MARETAGFVAAAHGAYARVRETLPEATAAIMEFIRTGSTTNLPVQVTVPAPAFDAPKFPVPAQRQSSRSTRRAAFTASLAVEQFSAQTRAHV